MIFFVLFLIALALLAQKLLSDGDLKHISEGLKPDRNIAEPNQPFDLLLSAENTGRRFFPFLRLKLPLADEMEPLTTDHIEKDTVYGSQQVRYTFRCTTWLKPHQRLEMHLPVRISHRGRYIIPHLTVSGGDFLGLKEESRTLERFNEVVVAPKPWDDTALPAVVGGFLGDISVNRYLYEDPVLTVGFREYTGREPMKMISWKQSARSNELLVRSFDHTMEPRVTVLLNMDYPLLIGPSSLETLCSMTRRVCETLEDRGISYSLKTNAALAGNWTGDKISEVHFGGGALHFEHVLELLGRATGQVTVHAGEFAARETGDGTVCSRILITDSEGQPDAAVLAKLMEVSGGNLLILTPPENAGDPGKASDLGKAGDSGNAPTGRNNMEEMP